MEFQVSGLGFGVVLEMIIVNELIDNDKGMDDKSLLVREWIGI